MLNRSASLAMSTSGLKALPGKLDIKRHSPSILYILESTGVTRVSSQVNLTLLHANNNGTDQPAPFLFTL